MTSEQVHKVAEWLNGIDMEEDPELTMRARRTAAELRSILSTVEGLDRAIDAMTPAACDPV